VSAVSFADRFTTARDRTAAFCRARAAEGGAEAPMLQGIAAELARLSPPEKIDPSHRLPGCRHYESSLPEALRGPLGSVAEAFAALEPEMRWVQTEGYREKLGETYMANYAYTNLVGWKGLVPHERIACGIFVIGPGQHYPDHHHAAEEIYFPFCGDTLWSQGGAPAGRRAPGSSIHNLPWQRHEMTTVETPLFVLYCWRGAVNESASLIQG